MDGINPESTPVADPIPSAATSQRPTLIQGITGPIHPFICLNARGPWVSISLALIIILGFIAVVAELLQCSLLQSAAAGHLISPAQADSNDARVRVIAVLQTLVHLSAWIGFCLWIHRAHRNLPALQAAGLKFTFRWAVGSYFVPFLNLVRHHRARHHDSTS